MVKPMNRHVRIAKRKDKNLKLNELLYIQSVQCCVAIARRAHIDDVVSGITAKSRENIKMRKQSVGTSHSIDHRKKYVVDCLQK